MDRQGNRGEDQQIVSDLMEAANRLSSLNRRAFSEGQTGDVRGYLANAFPTIRSSAEQPRMSASNAAGSDEMSAQLNQSKYNFCKC